MLVVWPTLKTMTPHLYHMQVSYQYWCGSYDCGMIGHENISCYIVATY